MTSLMKYGSMMQTRRTTTSLLMFSLTTKVQFGTTLLLLASSINSLRRKEKDLFLTLSKEDGLIMSSNFYPKISCCSLMHRKYIKPHCLRRKRVKCNILSGSSSLLFSTLI